MAAAAGTQQPSMPVVGLLNTSSPEAHSERLAAFRQSPKSYRFGTKPDHQANGN